MDQTNASGADAHVAVRNVGGIQQTDVDFSPGVTILVGRNATNRTSFLQALMAGIGSTDVAIKGDADAAEVELTLGTETYAQELRRNGAGVTTTGDPYLDDPTVAELFAFLLESNEARRAVATNDDLRELMLRPVDTDEIRAEIERLERERDEVDEQLDELASLKGELPRLERRKRELEDEIETTRSELADAEAEIESLDAGVDETRAEKRELESKLEDLRAIRADLESVRSDIDIQEESIRSLKRERSDLEEERAALPDGDSPTEDDIDRRLGQLRDRKRALESELSELQDVIQFNEEMLEGEETRVRNALSAADDGAEDLSEQLLGDDRTRCWTCGSDVEREQIESTLETIRSVRREQMGEINDIESELADLQTEKREREERQRRRQSIDRKLDDVEAELDTRDARLEDLRDRRERLRERVETVEAEVEALESEDFSEILDVHKTANRLEFELGGLESDLEDVVERIETIEDRLTREDHLDDRRQAIREALEAERTRIERLERQAVEEFNERMADVLDILGYDNLSRVWIERTQADRSDGRRTADESAFHLHIVRTTDGGTSYEDTIDHLSESEREVIGLIFALAGYLVHDVHETVPFMLLDSLEAIDATRISDLVTYFAEYSTYLVVALLPEDAQALSDEYERITEI